MGDPIDFYGVLNIPKDSSPEDIRKAYKALVRRWHPDKNPAMAPRQEPGLRGLSHVNGNGDGPCSLLQALSDKEYRAMFGVYHNVDGERSARRGDRWASPNPSPCPSPRDARHRKHRSEGQADPKKANRTEYQYFTASGAVPRQKLPPVERKLECTLEELCRGCKKEIRFTREVLDKNTRTSEDPRFPGRGRSLGSARNQSPTTESDTSLQARLLDNNAPNSFSETATGQWIPDARPSVVDTAGATVISTHNQDSDGFEDEVKKLVSMGFEKTQAEVALAAADGDPIIAVEILMSQQG